jgi:CelD/BcsL family acetyltransferase involved in cellulose biosynthesis
MSSWTLRPVPFKFQLSDLTLFSLSVPLQVRTGTLASDVTPTALPTPPVDELMPASRGFAVRGLPLHAEVRTLTRKGDFFCYVPAQYKHCYIDLRQSFDDYQKKFSSKTRSTIQRKVRKYADYCGGTLRCQTYKTPAELAEFFERARAVSKASYQERLLNAGLPHSDTFIRNAVALAAEDRVRAYLLFDGERPVSYLYCPVNDGILTYAYLGYEPAYMDKSVGTVLQWLALQDLFAEGRFRYFDFGEGQSDHKRLFSTHQRHCANVFMLPRNLRNAAIIYGHLATNYVSCRLGETLDRLGIKARIKRLIRFRAA